MKDARANCVIDLPSLREALEYSSKFYEDRFYVVIDAESFGEFEDRECFQLANDLLLVANFCQVKLIVVIGHFRSRMRIHKRKRLDFLGQILSASEKLKGYLEQITMVGLDSSEPRLAIESGIFKPEDAILAAKVGSIVIFPAAKVESGKPVDVIDISQAIFDLSQADKDNLFSKIIIISSHKGIFDSARNFLAQLTCEQAKKMKVTGQFTDIVMIAVDAIDKMGIKRVHIIDGRKSGGLLIELYTKGGSGTMIYRGDYELIRSATEADAAEVYSLIVHYAKMSMVILQSFAKIRKNIKDFVIATIDGHVVACARLRCFEQEGKAIVSAVVVNPRYICQDVGKKLLAEVESRARTSGSKMISLVNPGWWLYHGFNKGSISDLPDAIKKDYAQRGMSPKILTKILS